MWSTPAAAAQSAPAGGDGQRRRQLGPDLAGAIAPATDAARPTSAVATSSARGHVPARPRNAVMIVAGSGGQPAISRSTGTTSATEPSTP